MLCACYLCSVLAVGVSVNSVGHGNDLLLLFVFCLFCSVDVACFTVVV